MELVIGVAAGIVLAFVAPWLYRLAGARVGWILALLPLAIFCYFATLVGSVDQQRVITSSYQWIPALGLAITFYLDGLSLLFVLMIAGIGVWILIYSSGYLEGQAGAGTFYCYLLIFMSAMLGLVLAGNVLALYVFWELTTITSFLLIGFKHEQESARKSAVQSLLTTTVGGLAMLAGLLLLGWAGESFELAELLERGEQVREHAAYPAILILILLGAATKSAQFPFHFWLPNAMAAPTPVSAYLHSATMVKAGVYLLARLLPILGGTAAWQAAVIAVGAVTMLVSAIMALYQHDLKRILAYLTINVLGMLVMLLGVGTELAVKAAMVYLVAHALYKAALFMVAGTIDHQTHTRDIRELGGLGRRMPVTALAAVLAALSLAGIVPLLGFVGKEMYLEATWKAPYAAWLLSAASVAASGCVVAAALLVVWRPFWRASTPHTHESKEGRFSLWLGPLWLASAGFALGLAPQTLLQPLIEPAVSATRGTAAEIKLALWHGVNAPLVLSMTAIVLGVGSYVLRDTLVARLPLVPLAAKWGADAWYDRTMGGLNWVATTLTRRMQHGYLRHYVRATVGVLVLLVGTLVGITLASTGLPIDRIAWTDIRLHEAVAVVLIMCATLLTVLTKSRPQAVAALGVIGFSMSWIYALFGAPDLAITQIVVDALTVLLFVLAFPRLPRFSLLSSPGTRWRDAALSLTAGAGIASMLLLAMAFDRHQPVSQFFAENSYREAHGRNVVNVILVDFRALDTLGEITVLATAAVGVYALMKLVVKKRAVT